MYQYTNKNAETFEITHTDGSTMAYVTGFVTEVSDKYGRRIKEVFSMSVEEAKYHHRYFVSNVH